MCIYSVYSVYIFFIFSTFCIYILQRCPLLARWQQSSNIYYFAPGRSHHLIKRPPQGIEMKIIFSKDIEMKINIVGHKVKTDHALISTKTIQFSAH